MFFKANPNTNKSTMPFSAMATFAFRYSKNFGLMAIGVMVLYSIGAAKNTGYFLNILGISVLIALASFAVGSIIGFLFGIPHTIPQSSQQVTTQASSTVTPTNSTSTQSSNQSTVTAAPLKSNFTPSTNLEQIADWLTKIMVGVGLTQISKIIGYFNRLCLELGQALQFYTGNTNSAAIVGAIIILALVEGFLIVYLWTYLYLIRIQDSMVHDILDIMQSKIEDSDLHDKHAIDVANTQLNLPVGAPDTSEDELLAAFSKASKKVLSSLFFMTVQVRKEYWNKDQARMERIIPILKALIRLDSGFEFPENFSELGFALKDKRSPDYTEAINKFDEAIKAYQDEDAYGYKAITYFNRAFCYIKLDPNFNAVPPVASAADTQAKIKADLAEAVKENYVRQIVQNSSVIRDWQALNP